jgi:hypothetical protein
MRTKKITVPSFTGKVSSGRQRQLLLLLLRMEKMPRRRRGM